MQNIAVIQKDNLWTMTSETGNIIHKIAVHRDLEVHLLDTTSIYSFLNADTHRQMLGKIRYSQQHGNLSI